MVEQDPPEPVSAWGGGSQQANKPAETENQWGGNTSVSKMVKSSTVKMQSPISAPPK